MAKKVKNKYPQHESGKHIDNEPEVKEFFYQKVKIKPTKGLTLIWPSDFTHTHRGVPATNDTKIIATGWITNS